MITKTYKGVKLVLSKINIMYFLDLSSEENRGLQEFNRIKEMEKIR